MISKLLTIHVYTSSGLKQKGNVVDRLIHSLLLLHLTS